MSKKYIIDEEILIKLLGKEFELSALRKGGVDRWELYGNVMWKSLDKYRKENTPDKERYCSVYEIGVDRLKNFEKFPYEQRWEKDEVVVCVKSIFGEESKINSCIDNTCVDCWNREYEEGTK